MRKTKEIMENKIKEIDTKTLKESATLLMNDFRDGAGISFVLILNELETRMEEKEYTEFYDNL